MQMAYIVVPIVDIGTTIVIAPNLYRISYEKVMYFLSRFLLIWLLFVEVYLTCSYFIKPILQPRKS